MTACARALTLLFCGASSSLLAQRVITTFAGTDWIFLGDGRPAQQAPISGAITVAIDADRNLFLADRNQHRIFRVDRNGTLRVLAGTGLIGSAGDGGPAVAALLSGPSGIAVDATGNVFFSDSSNNRIRRISPDGIITSVAGSGGPNRFGGDGGPALQAGFFAPTILRLDPQGRLVILDAGNNRIRRIAPDGTISTIAGNGQFASAGDGGPATSASFISANDFTFDPQGILYVTDFGGHRLRRIGADGIISTIAGNGVAGFAGDGGPSANAQFRGPAGVGADSLGNVYVADANNGRIRRIDSQGIISTFAGTGQVQQPIREGVPPLQTPIQLVTNLAIANDNSLYYVDRLAQRVRRIAADTVFTVAGNGQYRPFLSGITQASGIFFEFPTSVALDSLGNAFVYDQSSQGFFRISPNRSVTLLSGNDSICRLPSANNTPVANSGLCSVSGLHTESNGTISIAESGNRRVRRLAPDGTVSTIAGSGNLTTPPGFGGDGGPAAQALLSNPTYALQDQAGNTIFTDSFNSRVRRITPAGVIQTIAGTGTPGSAGDGGPASAAQLNTPIGLALDAAGNLYVSDASAQRIRRISTSGIISTFAGSGSAGFSGDGGPAAAAQLNDPRKMSFDAADNLYFADRRNHRIRMIGTDGIIRTVAGIGRPVFSGDGGPPSEAGLNSPTDVTFDSLGNMYIADAANLRIRVVQPASSFAAANPCGFSISVRSQSFSASGGSRAVLVGANAGCSWGVTDLSPFVTVSAGASGTGPGVVRYSVAPNPGTLPRSAALTIAGQRHVIRQAGAPPLVVAPEGFTLAFGLGSNPVNRSLSVSVAGSATLSFAVSATSVGNWLSITPASGSTSAQNPVRLTLTINPRNLTAGTFAGRVDLFVATTGEQFSVPVSVSVSRTSQNLLTSQTGLFFRAAAGSTAPIPQAFNVVNSGAGTMPWTLTAATSTGGNWLTAATTSGTSVGGQTPPVATVNANASALAPGDYSGEVRVTAPDAANGFQSLSAVLNVVAAGTPIRPEFSITGLTFVGATGGASPADQATLLRNPTTAEVRYTAAIAFTNGSGWASVAPATGAIAPGASATLVVTPNTRGLAAGVYRGVINVTYAGVTETGRVDLLLIVAADAGNPAARRLAGSCRPTRLLPNFLAPEPVFDAAVGWPRSVILRVNDDCGDALTAGSVSVQFSNGDPPLALIHIDTGRWTSTWPARNVSAGVTLTARATDAAGELEGSVDRGGGVAANNNPPLVNPGGVTDAASFAGRQPVSPGSLVSIFGGRLAEELGIAASLPLATQLAGTQASIAGRPLPLVFTSDGQVNALIPYDLEQNVTHQLVVRRSGRISVPEPVLVSTTQPAVFTVDGSGGGQGHIYGFTAAGEQVLQDAARPSARGTILVVYCTGLGPVTPTVAAGTAAPSSPIAETANPVSVTIGGAEADILFAGLTPGFTGLYQINLRVPEGAPAGVDVPLVITVAGRQSGVVTMAVEQTSGERVIGGEQ